MKYFLIFVLMMLPLVVSADAVEIDGISYNLLSNTKIAEVTMNPNGYSGDVIIPELVSYDGIDYSVKSIGEWAFNGSGLTSITIPNSVTSIGGSAFSWCIGLTSVSIPNSVTSIGEFVFSDCLGLTSVSIPNSVTSIESGAFSGCTSLTSIDIPNNVTSIGSGAFSNCTSLTSIDIPNSVTFIDGLAFIGTPWLENQPDGVVYAGKVLYKHKGTMPEGTNINIEDGTLSIASEAFSYCRGLTSVTIPGSVTYIGDCAFQYCSGLTSIEIPNSVTSINSCAFYDCTNLTSIDIPSSVTSIGEDAFKGCTSLSSIDIPSSVTSIGLYAFLDCTNLTSIDIPNSVTSIGIDAFKGTPWYDNQPDGIVYAGKVLYTYKGTMPEGTSLDIKEGTLGIAHGAFEGCYGLTSVTIPSSVTYIGEGAFIGTPWLENQPDGVVYAGKVLYVYKGTMPEGTNINIEDGTLSIANYAFGNCSGLTSVNIPNSVTYIGDGAFGGCSGLTSINIPNSVTYIGWRAFDGCSGLNSVTIPNSVTSIENLAFYRCYNLVEIISKIENPFVIALNTFSYFTFGNATLDVPAGTMGKYKATDGWKKFVFIKDGSHSSIKNVKSEEKMELRRYTLDGRTIQNSHKGINIILMNNGTTKKVLVK